MHCRVIQKGKKKRIRSVRSSFFPADNQPPSGSGWISLLKHAHHFQFGSYCNLHFTLHRPLPIFCLYRQNERSSVILYACSFAAFDRPATSTIRHGYRSSRKRGVARVYLTKTVASCAETSLTYLPYYVLRCTSNVLLILYRLLNTKSVFQWVGLSERLCLPFTDSHDRVGAIHV